MRERGQQGLESAIALFSEAAIRDPDFARAHAGIAEAAALLPLYSNVSHATVADTIRASAARAIAHDSLLAAPHVAVGLLEKGLGRWADGERELLAALRLDPNDASAHQNLGELYFTTGRIDESRTALERAAVLEPTEAVIVAEFAYAAGAIGGAGQCRAGDRARRRLGATQSVCCLYRGDRRRASGGRRTLGAAHAHRRRIGADTVLQGSVGARARAER